MTAKRDLKKRVRARQARTGERYTAALAHVLGPTPRAGRVPVTELADVSAAAAQAGLTGRVLIFPELAARIDVTGALRRIRAALTATEDDPATELLRGVLLLGRRPPSRAPARLASLTDARRFLVRARAGLAGVSPGGRMLAIPAHAAHDTEMVVCILWGGPIPGFPDLPSSVVLWSAEEMMLDMDTPESPLLRFPVGGGRR